MVPYIRLYTIEKTTTHTGADKMDGIHPFLWQQLQERTNVAFRAILANIYILGILYNQQLDWHPPFECLAVHVSTCDYCENRCSQFAEIPVEALGYD
jgi:hypothetical protein